VPPREFAAGDMLGNQDQNNLAVMMCSLDEVLIASPAKDQLVLMHTAQLGNGSRKKRGKVPCPIPTT